MTDRRRRICHVITRLELGGAQQNTLYTVGHLDRALFAPCLVTGTGGLLDDEARNLSTVEVHFLTSLRREVRPGSDVKALVELTRLFRRISPDIVHTHSSKAGILGRWAAHLAGVPVIVHSIHGFGFHPRQNPLVRSLFLGAEKATAPITTRFVAVSRANLELGAALGLFGEERATVIRSGIELGRFRPAAGKGNGRAGEDSWPDMPASPPAAAESEIGLAIGAQREIAAPRPSETRSGLRAEIGAGPSDPIAGMIACLKPQKAPEDFVAAAALVARRLPAARFVLAGDGELRPRVEAAIQRKRLEGRFHLLGWRRDVPEILREIDVLVLTSRWEGLPRVFPEAMASGLPIVACRVDGAPEAVEEGVTGFLCEPGDVVRIAERLAALLSDPGRAREMGSRGRERVREWDIDDMVRRQERLYLSLLDPTGSATAGSGARSPSWPA